MCRNIKPLFNFDPPATKEEIRAASLQYVRKISGFTHPSEKNSIEFDKAVGEIANVTEELLNSLITTGSPRNREVEAERARKRAEKRFGMR